MQQLKAQIFNDDLKGKLENPNLSLESWIAFLHERAVDVRIEKVETGKTMMGGKKVGYQVTYIDPMYPNMLPAVRSKSDFALLQNMLKIRFPDAVVPLITKGELDNLHLLELYIRELAANPFLRMDVTFSDFINGKLREFKQVKRNQKKMSEGTLRWLQQMTEYHEIDTPDEMIRSVKNDLDQLERAQKGLVNSFKTQIRALSFLQEATGSVSSALGDYLSMEQTSESNASGSVAGLPAGRLRGNLAKLIEVNQNHQNGLVTSYDGSSYERLMIHPVFIELKMITAMKKVVDYLANAKSDFEKAKSAFESVSPDDANRGRLQTKLDQKNIVFYKAKGAMGFELEKFKTFRTVKFQDFFQSYVKFNLRGAKEINQQWASTGISLNQQEEEKFYAKDTFYKVHQANGSSSSPAVSKRITTKAPTNTVGASNQSFQPRVNRPTFTGPSASSEPDEEDDWSDEEEPTSNFNPSSAVTLNRPKPPKAPSMPAMPSNYGSSTPPSFGGPPKPVESSMPKPPVPTFGGGGFNPGPKPPMASTFSPPPTQPEIKAFSNPTPPSSNFGGPKPPVPSFGGAPSSNFGGPPSNNFGGGFGAPPPSNTNIPSFGAPPSQNTSIPTFGAPPPQNTSLPTFGSPPPSGPAPPSFGGAPPAFGSTRNAAKPPTAPAPKKGGFGGFGGNKGGAKPPKLGGGGGGGPPKLGGGMPGGLGGAGFLADIKKGNAVKLSKVPDSEKSKEIGGDKGKGPLGAVVGGGGGGGRGPAPPMGGGGGPPRFGGGGGGMFGELSNKLQNRR